MQCVTRASSVVHKICLAVIFCMRFSKHTMFTEKTGSIAFVKPEPQAYQPEGEPYSKKLGV